MSARQGRASLLLIALALCSSTVQGADPGARYVGVHELGVNRVSPQRRAGRVSITRGDGGLLIEGEARREPYYLQLSGAVQRIDARELVVQGELAGVPDMSWADEAPRQRTTRGTFTFRVSKGRKFWRLYEVDGVPCVCDDGCGNDFCYIDIDVESTRDGRTKEPSPVPKRPLSK